MDDNMKNINVYIHQNKEYYESEKWIIIKEQKRLVIA